MYPLHDRILSPDKGPIWCSYQPRRKKANVAKVSIYPLVLVQDPPPWHSNTASAKASYHSSSLHSFSNRPSWFSGDRLIPVSWRLSSFLPCFPLPHRQHSSGMMRSDRMCHLTTRQGMCVIINYPAAHPVIAKEVRKKMKAAKTKQNRTKERQREEARSSFLAFCLPWVFHPPSSSTPAPLPLS